MRTRRYSKKIKSLFILSLMIASLLYEIDGNMLSADDVIRKKGVIDCKGTCIGIQFIVKEPMRPGETRDSMSSKIRNMVNELNGYYQVSKVNMHAVVSHIEFKPILTRDAVTILNDMHSANGDFSNILNNAETFGADYAVVLVNDLLVNNRSLCGRAYKLSKTIEDMSRTDNAMLVMNPSPACGAHTLAHELGHLMGLNHGYLVDRCNPDRGHATAAVSYANGYGEGNCDGILQTGEWGDIMVGGHMRQITGENKNQFEIFSNPDVYNDKCGVSRQCGDPKIGNAAKWLNDNSVYYIHTGTPCCKK